MDPKYGPDDYSTFIALVLAYLSVAIWAFVQGIVTVIWEQKQLLAKVFHFAAVLCCARTNDL